MSNLLNLLHQKPFYIFWLFISKSNAPPPQENVTAPQPGEYTYGKCHAIPVLRWLCFVRFSKSTTNVIVDRLSKNREEEEEEKNEQH